MNTTRKNRMLLVDQDDVLRAGLLHVLKNIPGENQVVETDNLETALDLVSSKQINLVLLRNRMQDGDIAEFIAIIKNGSAELRTLILLEQEEDFWKALDYNAEGYEMRQSPSYQLEAAVKSIGQGYAWIGTVLSTYLLKNMGRDYLIAARARSYCISKTDLTKLTAREKEVMLLLSDGLSTREIAEELQISPKTAKLHISVCIRKMQVQDRAQAVARFLRSMETRIDQRG